ncbi:MAG: membrane protein insertion efficiency factor YidD [Bacilli bacterium]|nr:membrane protein insertion efficiency factor YidD [Bacilli bacterium]
MNKLVIRLIEYYQKEISPKTNPHCKYCLTCSQYAKECFMKFNFFIACILTFFRLLRCNPFSKGGYDPCPKTYIERQITLMFSVIELAK